LTNTASGDWSAVGGGGLNTASGLYATVGGGGTNSAGADHATVSGGYGNSALDAAATVAGGYSNRAGSSGAFVGGGAYNDATGAGTVIAGGEQNVISATYATIAGGSQNVVSATYGTIGGGRNSIVTGNYGTVPGGDNNAALGAYSFAAGHQAMAAHNGSFVWSDSGGSATSQRNDQFLVQTNGGALFQDRTGLWVELVWDITKPISTSTGAYLSGGGIWTDNSDRNLKENFEPVDGQEVLARLAELPVTTWNYRAEDPSIRHMGPVAQDFYATFGLGVDDTHLAALDTNGVALVAIQELYRQNQALQAENAELSERVDDLEARLAALEQRNAGAPAKAGLSWGWSGLLGLVVIVGLWEWRVWKEKGR
jgi:hypothetical protein